MKWFVGILLTVGLLVASIDCRYAQGQSYSADVGKLVGRWVLVQKEQIGRPYEVFIGGHTIRMRADDGCNEVTMLYSVVGRELRANSTTVTLVACIPRQPYKESLEKAFRHSKYEVDGDTLRLTPSSLNTGETFEFHRAR